MTGPFKAQGTVIAISNEDATATAYASATFKTIGGVLNIPELGGDRSVIDTTDLSSTAKTKLPGLIDNGSITFNLNYLEGDQGQDEAQEAFGSGELRWIKVTLPSPAAKAWHCMGFVKGFKVSGDMDAKIAASLAVELSGAAVWA